MRQFLKLLASRPGLALELSAASLFINFLSFADTIFVMIVLRRYVAHGFQGTLLLLALGALAAILLQYGLRLVRARLAQGLSREKNRALDDRFLAKLFRTRAAALSDKEAGREYLPDLNAVQQAYDPQKTGVLMDAPFSLLFVAAVYMLSPLLAAVVGAGMIATLIPGLIAYRSTHSTGKNLSRMAGSVKSLVSSAFLAADTVRSFGGRAFYRQTWRERMQSLERRRRRTSDVRELGKTMTSGSGVFMRVALYAVGAKLVVEGKLTFAALIGSSILGSYAIQKVAALAQIWPAIMDAKESRRRLDDFFDLPERPEGGRMPEEFGASIAFKEVKFTHPGGGALFENLTFDLPAGCRLAVTGYNGSGKTTFCRLLTGLLKPDEGAIMAGGVPEEDFDFNWWRHRLIYMPQEPYFLPGTIRENILCANPNLEQEELNRVVRAAGLRPFLDSSAGGMEMRLGAGGRNLPLGIRKRLALARALAVDGQIAVMDEPGDGLDLEGRRALYEALNDMARQGKTMVVVSHDPKILKAAEYVLDLGVKPTPTFLVTDRASERGEDQ